MSVDIFLDRSDILLAKHLRFGVAEGVHLRNAMEQLQLRILQVVRLGQADPHKALCRDVRHLRFAGHLFSPLRRQTFHVNTGSFGHFQLLTGFTGFLTVLQTGCQKGIG